MRDEYKHISDLIERWLLWYINQDQGLGYKNQSVEQSMIELGVIPQKTVPWYKQPWMSHKETIVKRHSVPGYGFPSKSVSHMNKIYAGLPKDMQRLVIVKFHPLDGAKTNKAGADRMGLTLRTYERKISNLYQEIARKYKIYSGIT